MRQPTPERYLRSIVLVGDLNPKIFQPAWFAAEKLIGKQEADGAKIGLIHRDVASFSIEWARIEVLRERFLAETSQEMYDEPLRDLVLGTFSILRHTPIRAMGINTTMHFRMESEAKWHQAGHRLAPKDIWTDVLDEPGMTAVAMREARRRDGRRGNINVRIEPSGEVNPGILFSVNDHYDFSSQDVIGCDEMLTSIRDAWGQATKRAEDIIYAMLGKITA